MLGDVPAVLIHDHIPIREDLDYLSRGHVAAKVFCFSIDVEVGPMYAGSTRALADWPQRSFRQMKKALDEIRLTRGRARLVETFSDLQDAREGGPVGVVMGSEGARLLGGNIELLDSFYLRGLRVLQLAWALPNELLDGGSLSDFGAEVVERCNQLGIVIDLTHLPETAFYDALAQTRQPAMISHCAARAVTTDLSDKKIEAMAGNGGVMGIHFYRTYLLPPGKALDPGSKPTITDLLKQIDHFVDVAGARHVSLGGDFFPRSEDWAAFQEAQGVTSLDWAIPDAGHLPEVARSLASRGYSRRDIGRIMSDNFIRVCRDVFVG